MRSAAFKFVPKTGARQYARSPAPDGVGGAPQAADGVTRMPGMTAAAGPVTRSVTVPSKQGAGSGHSTSAHVVASARCAGFSDAFVAATVAFAAPDEKSQANQSATLRFLYCCCVLKRVVTPWMKSVASDA